MLANATSQSVIALWDALAWPLRCAVPGLCYRSDGGPALRDGAISWRELQARGLRDAHALTVTWCQVSEGRNPVQS
jgi:hypothetical protein